jgi:hypothetical protein
MNKFGSFVDRMHMKFKGTLLNVRFETQLLRCSVAVAIIY